MFLERLACFPFDEVVRVIAEVLHATIQFGNDFAGDRNFRRVLLQIVPQFGDEEEFLLGRKASNFREAVQDHKIILTWER